jgi:hypothetical protein
METALQFPQIIQTSCFAIILLAMLVSAVFRTRSAVCFWAAYISVLAAAGVMVYDLVVGNRNAVMPDTVLIIVSIALCRIPFAMYRANRETARDKKNAEPPEVLKRKIEAAANFAFGQHRRLVCERYYLDTPFKVLDGARYENAKEHLAHPYVNNFQGAPNIGMFATRPFESAIIGVTVFYQEYLRKFFITVSATYFGKNGKYLENRPILRLCETNLGDFDTVGIDFFISAFFDKAFGTIDTALVEREIARDTKFISVAQRCIEWNQMLLAGKYIEQDWETFTGNKEAR